MVSSAGRLKFRVESSDFEDFYNVEFKDQNGECSCRDFVVRCKPVYRQSKTTVEYGNAEKTRCKHINQVLIFIANKAISGVLK